MVCKYIKIIDVKCKQYDIMLFWFEALSFEVQYCESYMPPKSTWMFIIQLYVDVSILLEFIINFIKFINNQAILLL